MKPLPRARLSPDGPQVARLCLGAMMFGDQADATEAFRILDAYRAAGGNFIDTADVYAQGRSESILGTWLDHHREEVVLATKLGNPMQDQPGSGGISRRWILAALEGSLNRLRTETIDLYYLHADDNATPLEETIGTLGELIASGRIRGWGFSNFRAWKIAEMIRVADGLGVPRPIAAQPYYHLLNRVAEAEYLPACRHFGIGAVTYSPLARGVLTGKYRGETVPEGSRAARGDARLLETEFRPETIAAANAFAEQAEASGREPIALAIRWVLANAAVASVLIGPKSVAQLTSYLRAFEIDYGAEDEAALDRFCAPGHTPAPAYSDPRYPYRGRIARLDPEPA